MINSERPVGDAGSTIDAQTSVNVPPRSMETRILRGGMMATVMMESEVELESTRNLYQRTLDSRRNLSSTPDGFRSQRVPWHVGRRTCPRKSNPEEETYDEARHRNGREMAGVD